ncbi:MAG: DUF937 domain-containing protein, partial [Saprospiraceae bacterium]
MNLVNLLKNYATPDLIASAASFLGESQHATSKGIDTTIPAILGGLLNTSSNTSQMGQVWDLINHKENNINLLSDLSGLFSGDTSLTGPDSLGASFIKILFGSNNDSLLSGISKISGLNHSGSAMKILSLIAPLILSFLKKKVKTEGYGASGLSAWIGSQKNEILSSIPTELSSVMNFGSHSKMNPSKATAEVETEGSNWWPWLIGIFGLLGLMWFLMKSCNTQKLVDNKAKMEAQDSVSKKAAEVTSDSLKNIEAQAINNMYEGVDSIVRLKWMTLGNMIKLNLPDGNMISIPERGVEGKLVTWIMDSTKHVDKTTWFDFDRILFETGSANINAASKEQINNIASVLKAFPKVNIKIGGYTDNAGKAMANKKLSQARAEAMMKELIALNIDTKRLAAEGYGVEFPVGDNATPEGREM